MEQAPGYIEHRVPVRDLCRKQLQRVLDWHCSQTEKKKRKCSNEPYWPHLLDFFEVIPIT